MLCDQRFPPRPVVAACRHVETRLIASLLGFHAFNGRQAIPRPKRSGVKRTTQRWRRGAAHCLSRRWRSVVVETRLIASLLGFHAFNGRLSNPRPKRSGVKRTTQRGRRGAAHCLSRRGRSVVVETRLIASLLGFHAFNGRQAIPRPKRSGVKRTTQRWRRGAAHCLSRRGRSVVVETRLIASLLGFMLSPADRPSPGLSEAA